MDEVEGLSLTLVEDDDHWLLWNTLVDCEHPRGIAIFAGCQIKCLVESSHGLLAAVGFAAPAKHLRARDEWMNWSAEQRQAHLHHVLCMNRFLIRPATRCRNLASRVLGMVMRRLADDFERRYRFRLWLVEAYTEPGTTAPACGRPTPCGWAKSPEPGGADVPATPPSRSVKTLYVHELDRNWHGHLGVARIELKPALEPGEGLDIEE